MPRCEAVHTTAVSPGAAQPGSGREAPTLSCAIPELFMTRGGPRRRQGNRIWLAHPLRQSLGNSCASCSIPPLEKGRSARSCAPGGDRLGRALIPTRLARPNGRGSATSPFQGEVWSKWHILILTETQSAQMRLPCVLWLSSHVCSPRCEKVHALALPQTEVSHRSEGEMS